jgi:predicted metal-binding protein
MRGNFTMKNQDVLLVCTLCGGTSQARSQGIKSNGEKLLEQIQTLHQTEALDVSVQAVRCMAVCKHSCAIAVMGRGKRTYLFGDLPVEPEQLAATAATVLDYARQYHANSEGIVPHSERPELLRSRTLVVLPALP